MTTTLLLDVDGVLQSSPPGLTAKIEHAYRWKDGFGAFERDVMSDPAEAASLVGQGDLLQLLDRVLPRHVDGLSAAEFVDRWLAESISVNHGLLDMLPRLTLREIYLATNQERVRGEYVAGLYRQWIAGTLMSYELGHRKPTPAYFTAALSRIGRTPAECLLVDDKEEFVAGAAAMGIPGILFRSTGQLEVEFGALGLLR